MLVLARRVNESIVIPVVKAVVRVVAARPHAVRLGIEAPPEVVILRGELYEAPVAEVVPPASPAVPVATVQPEHVVRNHLNNLSLGLGMLRRHLTPQMPASVQALLERLTDECQMLGRRLPALLRSPAAALPLLQAEPGVAGS